MNEDQITQNIMSMRQEIATLTEQVKAAFKRIDEQKQLTESVQKLATSTEVMAAEIKRMGAVQTRQQADIDALRMKPARQWEGIVAQLITLAVAAIGGGIIANIIK